MATTKKAARTSSKVAPAPADEPGCDDVEREQRALLTNRIDKSRELQTTAANRAVAAMAHVRQTWPAITARCALSREANRPRSTSSWSRRTADTPRSSRSSRCCRRPAAPPVRQRAARRRRRR